MNTGYYSSHTSSHKACSNVWQKREAKQLLPKELETGTHVTPVETFETEIEPEETEETEEIEEILEMKETVIYARVEITIVEAVIIITGIEVEEETETETET